MKDYRTYPNQAENQPNKIPAPTMMSFTLIIVANLIPLIGVIFFGWSLANIILLYWVENLIIGFWNVPRILYAGKTKDSKSNLSLGIFFIFHYGMFCFVHGIFILSFLGVKESPFDILNKGVMIAAATMFITIGLSFYQDYIATKDYLNWLPSNAMHYPYGHIFVIHIAIIIGAVIVQATGSTMVLLVFLVIGKAALETLGKKKLNRWLGNKNHTQTEETP